VNASPTGDGPEAAARSARYEALLAIGEIPRRVRDPARPHPRRPGRNGAAGAGPRSGGCGVWPGCRPGATSTGVALLRPLLDVPRAATRRTCEELSLPVWEDPHNADPRYTRSRVRAALPALTAVLGEGLVANLATTARLAAADAELLDALAADKYSAAKIRDLGEARSVSAPPREPEPATPPELPSPSLIADLVEPAPAAGLRIDALSGLPAALRTRVLRLYAIDAAGGAVTSAHIDALDSLVTDWHGQGGVALPGGYRIVRRRNVLWAGAEPAEEMK